MIEPHELKNKQFSKVMRGYSQTEVDEHIEFVIDEYTKLYRENDELSRKLSEAEAMLEAYRKDEESIRSALMSAQRASARIINDANDRADELLRATKLDCEKVLAEFRVDVGQERKKLIALKKAITDYKAGVYSKYIKHIEYLEKISPDYDLGELDLSEEEIAASDEGYVRRVLEDVKADLAEAAARREAENERRMADSRSGVEQALNEVDSAQPVDPVYYSDVPAEPIDAGIPDAEEPAAPAYPADQGVAEDYGYADGTAQTEPEQAAEDAYVSPDIPADAYADAPAEAPADVSAAYDAGQENAAADAFMDEAAGQDQAYNNVPQPADEPSADLSGFADVFADLELPGTDDAQAPEGLDIDIGSQPEEQIPDSVPADDIMSSVELPPDEDDAPQSGKKADKKAKKADRSSVRATIEELNRKFRGESSDIDREYEEALKKLSDTDGGKK